MDRPVTIGLDLAKSVFQLSSDIRNWPGGDMKDWPTLMLLRLWFRAPQRAFAKARCGASRGGGSCPPGW